MKRRKFNQTIAKAGLISLLPWTGVFCTNKSKLNILVLGGTNFVGPAIVQDLLDKGHQVTLFNRGITNPHLFPELEKIRGNREDGLQGYEQLKGKNWDVVIDVWPDNPNLVKEAIQMLKSHTKHYAFISSIAVYQDFRQAGLSETSPLRQGTEYEPDNYNLNKVLCEKAVEASFPGKFTILRPGAIVGERDPGIPFPYLASRIAYEQEILAPDSNDPVQFVDVKDVASFLTNCLENKHIGHFNVIGPENTFGYKDLLLEMKKTLNNDVQIHWMDKSFLMEEMKLAPWVQLPFWIPLEDDPEPGFYQIRNAKAIAAGLTFRPVQETIKDAMRYFDRAAFKYGEGGGISLEREQEIIEIWKWKTE